MRLTKKILTGVLLLVGALNVLAGDGGLVLGTETGLPGEYEVRAYDVKTGVVCLRSGSVFTNRPYSSFPTDVQQKIAGWAADKAFRSSSELQISLDKQNPRRKIHELLSDGRVLITGREERVKYTVRLKNKTPFEMRNIRVSYIIFYEAEMNQRYEQNSSSREYDELAKNMEDVHTKTLKSAREERVVSIPPDTEIVLETKEVVLEDVKEDHAFNSNYGGKVRTYEGKLLGLHLMLSKTSACGGVLERTMENGQVPREDKRSAYKDDGKNTNRDRVLRSDPRNGLRR